MRENCEKETGIENKASETERKKEWMKEKRNLRRAADNIFCLSKFFFQS